MQREGRLTILVSGEVLRHGGRDGLVARDDALDQAAHGFNAQRQRNHIKQQQFASSVVARQLVGLDGRAQGHDFVGVEVVERGLAKKLGHGLLDLRHAGGAAHHDHALHIVFDQLRIAQRFANGGDASGCQGLGGLLEIGAADLHGQAAGGQGSIQRDHIRAGECFFGGAGSGLEHGFVFGGGGLQAGLLGHGGVGQGLVVIVSTQCRVASGGQDLKHALRQAQDGDVKGAATQIEHGINTLAGVVEAISNGRGGGLVDQAQHIQARQLRGVFGGLALGIVKVGGHGDDRAIQVVVEGVFGAVTQRGQNFGADFDGRLGALHRLDAEHALFAGDELIRQLAAVGNVLQATAHEAFDRGDGVHRV